VDAGVGGSEIVGFEEVGLRSVLFGGEDEVVGNDGVLVQNEVVGFG
jgi:hypothetical protein